VTAPEAKLAELGLTLPAIAAPLGAYVPSLRTGNYVYTSGQLPFVDGALSCVGKVGAEVSADDAKAAAAVCALNALAAIRVLVGELSAVLQIVKVVGYVASAPDFDGQPGVVNGASELLGALWPGKAGRHVRSAVGVAVLPSNAAVEIELVVEVSGDVLW
jgi:enamine deaminase RidA (YjgF/YER057c/UK114 family)